MNKTESEIKHQRILWDEAHKNNRLYFDKLAYQPNPFAKEVVKFIPNNGVILELGCGNGRDARFFTREKNRKVISVDFSLVVLSQLKDHSKKDGTSRRVFPVAASIQNLPFRGSEVFDIIYARSALQVDDTGLMILLNQLIPMIKQGGYLCIQGKTPDDFKIQRSKEVGTNLFADPVENAHLRRAWREEDILRIIDKFRLTLIEMKKTEERWWGKNTNFIHFIAQKL